MQRGLPPMERECGAGISVISGEFHTSETIKFLDVENSSHPE